MSFPSLVASLRVISSSETATIFTKKSLYVGRNEGRMGSSRKKARKQGSREVSKEARKEARKQASKQASKEEGK